MLPHVRIYTVNGGMLDSWVEHFNEQIIPTSAKYGVHVLGAWVNRPQNEFIWVREFDDEDTLKRYEASPERAAYLPINKQHLAKTEFRNVEAVLRAPVASSTTWNGNPAMLHVSLFHGHDRTSCNNQRFPSGSLNSAKDM